MNFVTVFFETCVAFSIDPHFGDYTGNVELLAGPELEAELCGAQIVLTQNIDRIKTS